MILHRAAKHKQRVSSEGEMVIQRADILLCGVLQEEAADCSSDQQTGWRGDVLAVQQVNIWLMIPVAYQPALSTNLSCSSRPCAVLESTNIIKHTCHKMEGHVWTWISACWNNTSWKMMFHSWTHLSTLAIYKPNSVPPLYNTWKRL